MKPLRVGVIGLGVGEQHAAAWSSDPRCRLVALCDLLEEKLERVGSQYPEARLTLDANDILDDADIDVVTIASYDDHHAEQVLRALANDKHVFAEKPLCLLESDAVAIRDSLRRKPELALSSNLILRLSPRFQLVRAMIRDGELGEIFSAEADYNYGRLQKITEGWRGSVDSYSVTLGGGVHVVDLLLWLLGKRVEKVVGFGNQIASAGSGFRYNDYVAALLIFEGGAIGKVSSNFGCVYPHFHGLSVFGDKGTFINGLGDARVYRTRDQATHESVDAEYPGVHKGDLIDSFVSGIFGTGKPFVDADDVFRCLSVCFAIDEAVRTGDSVEVDYL